MKVNTIVSIFLISANLYAKSAVAVEEQLNHNLRRLAKPSCGDGKVSGKEDCEPPNTATCDANCKTIDVDRCATVRLRCADACTKDDAGLNCDVATTCKRCNENDVGCTRNDCILPDDGTVCVEQSFKCVPDEIITTAATKPLATTATTTESAASVCAAANCRAGACFNDPCVSTQKACNVCVNGDVGCTGTCLFQGVFCGGSYKCEGCIEDGDACSGNCSGCCSKTSTNLGGGLGKICG